MFSYHVRGILMYLKIDCAMCVLCGEWLFDAIINSQLRRNTKINHFWIVFFLVHRTVARLAVVSVRVSVGLTKHNIILFL